MPSRPTALPTVWVPCPPWSVGLRVSSHGSYQESSPPRNPARSAGWAPSTPESELPTTMPVPVTPSWDHTRSAPIWRDVPLRAGGLGRGAPVLPGRCRQRSQALADQHPRHLRPAGEPGPHRRAAVHLDRVDQVVRHRVEPQPVQPPEQVALALLGGRHQPPVDLRRAGVPPGPTRRGGRKIAQVGLRTQHHEQPLAVQARLAGAEVDHPERHQQHHGRHRGDPPVRGACRRPGEQHRVPDGDHDRDGEPDAGGGRHPERDVAGADQQQGDLLRVGEGQRAERGQAHEPAGRRSAGAGAEPVAGRVGGGGRVPPGRGPERGQRETHRRQGQQRGQLRAGLPGPGREQQQRHPGDQAADQHQPSRPGRSPNRERGPEGGVQQSRGQHPERGGRQHARARSPGGRRARPARPTAAAAPTRRRPRAAAPAGSAHAPSARLGGLGPRGVAVPVASGRVASLFPAGAGPPTEPTSPGYAHRRADQRTTSAPSSAAPASAARYASWCTGGTTRSSVSTPSASAPINQARPVARTALDRGRRASSRAGVPASTTVARPSTGQSQPSRSRPKLSST